MPRRPRNTAGRANPRDPVKTAPIVAEGRLARRARAVARIYGAAALTEELPSTYAPKNHPRHD